MNDPRHHVPWHTSDVVGQVVEPASIARNSSRMTGRSIEGITFALGRDMHALEVEGELLASDRPTIPVPLPRESGVRLEVSRVALSAATVDVVVCDLSNDPRSEDFAPITLRSGRPPDPRTQRVLRSGFFPVAGASQAANQNERPPSTSTVRALK